MIVDVNFKGLKLQVIGNYYKGRKGSYEEQPEPESFEIEQVSYNDTDIFDVICALNAELELENLILDKFY